MHRTWGGDRLQTGRLNDLGPLQGGKTDPGCRTGGVAPNSFYYPGTEEAHTNPTRQRGECLRALAGASG